MTPGQIVCLRLRRPQTIAQRVDQHFRLGVCPKRALNCRTRERPERPIATGQPSRSFRTRQETRGGPQTLRCHSWARVSDDRDSRWAQRDPPLRSRTCQQLEPTVRYLDLSLLVGVVDEKVVPPVRSHPRDPLNAGSCTFHCRIQPESGHQAVQPRQSVDGQAGTLRSTHVPCRSSSRTRPAFRQMVPSRIVRARAHHARSRTSAQRVPLPCSPSSHCSSNVSLAARGATSKTSQPRSGRSGPPYGPR